MELDRRELLAGAGTGVAGLLAGCSGNNDGMSSEDVNRTLEKDTETESSTERPTETATPEPLMEGEAAYNEARITSREDVFDIEYDDRHDDDIYSLETLEEAGWRLFNQYNCDTNLEYLQEAASAATELTRDRSDGIDLVRFLAESIGDRVDDDVEFDYENLIIDQHTTYAGAVGQEGSVLFKDDDGEWNHHLFDADSGKWRGPAVETDYFSEGRKSRASTQSSRGFFGHIESLGAFGRNSDIMSWSKFEKDLNNYQFGKVRSTNTQIYIDPETYSEDLPRILRQDVGEYADFVRYLNDTVENTSSEAVEFSYSGEEWTHEEVKTDPDRFQAMMKAHL